MKQFEYIMWFLKEADGNEPVALIYEIDVDNERYATRMAEIYDDGKVVPIIEEGYEFITEASIPNIDEITEEKDFYGEKITKEEFDKIYTSSYYYVNIDILKIEK